VVEVGWENNKVEDNNSTRRGPSGKQTGYHYLTDNSIISGALGLYSLDLKRQPLLQRFSGLSQDNTRHWHIKKFKDKGVTIMLEFNN
jgi:hypothetical protein